MFEFLVIGLMWLIVSHFCIRDVNNRDLYTSDYDWVRLNPWIKGLLYIIMPILYFYVINFIVDEK